MVSLPISISLPQRIVQLSLKKTLFPSVNLALLATSKLTNERNVTSVPNSIVLVGEISI